MLKKRLNAVLYQEMDRQGFLKILGMGVIALTGLGAFLRLVNVDEHSGVAMKNAQDYDFGVYGGSTDGK